MTWQGFVKESKGYVGYKTTEDKIKFWKGFPRAWFIFHYSCAKDNLRLYFNSK